MFLTALNEVLKHECFYSNISNDKGGETYAGISRKFHPSWPGWALIDKEKMRYGGYLKRNYEITHPLMKGYIQSFYKEKFWDKINLSKVKDENLQNIIFDAYVNSGGNGIKVLQRTLNTVFGKKLVVDGAIGPITIATINSVNAKLFFDAFKLARESYYKAIAKGDNAIFLQGWLNRLSSFNYKAVGISLAGLVILGTATFFL